MEATPGDRAAPPPGAVAKVMRQALAGAVWLVRSVVAALVTAFADPPPPRSRRLRRFIVVADVAVAVVVYAMLVSSASTRNDELGLYPPQLLHLVGLASVLPLLARDRWPLTAWRSSWLVLIWGSFVLRGLFPFPLMAAGIAAFLLGLYSVASRCEREVAVGAWVVSLLTVVPLASDLWGIPALDPNGVLAIPVLVTIPIVFGYNVRVRRRAQRELAVQERRSEHEQAARAVLEERSRIARELHDVVAHHMSVIAIQAEAAPLEVPGTPELLKNRFAEIRATSLTALSEMRRILGVLRTGDDRSDTSPQPGLDRLDDLAANASAGGLTVTTSVSGRPV